MVISDDLEKKFKKKIYDEFGMKRGNISKIITKLIEDWCGTN